MKKTEKFAKRLVCLLLVVVSSLLPVIPAEALYSDYPGNWNAWEYNSDIGQYVANIAKAQDTKTRDNLGYADAWCAKFAMDCGERAGTKALNPPQKYGANTWTPHYYNNLIAAGGRDVSTWEARPGDIAFFDMNGRDGIDHVEIVYDNRDGIVYTVGGNTGGGAGKVNKRTIPGSAGDVQRYIYKIVRPNYYTIIDGEFFIRSTLTDSSKKVLDVYYGGDSAKYAKNVQICRLNGGNNQKFYISHVGDGWHRIQTVQSWKSLDVEGGYSRSGTNVIVWGNNNGDNQLWRFIPDGDGFRIQSKLGYYLDVSGGSTSDETNVQIWDGNGTAAQRWRLYKTGDWSLYTA